MLSVMRMLTVHPVFMMKNFLSTRITSLFSRLGLFSSVNVLDVRTSMSPGTFPGQIPTLHACLVVLLSLSKCRVIILDSLEHELLGLYT
jgi:hypothetical protein